jgi:putative ABC transport system permease protein
MAYSLLYETRLAARKIVRRPAHALVIAVLLGLPVGVSTAVFSILDATVLDAVPFPDAGQLYVVKCRTQGARVAGACPVYAAAAIQQDGGRLIDELAYFSHGPSRLEVRGNDTETLPTRKVSSSFFSALRLAPEYGRWFLSSDNATGDQLAVLSYRTWKTTFEAKLEVLGSTILLDGVPYVVVGVMPEKFAFPDAKVGAWVLDPLTVKRIENAGLFDSTILARIGDRTTADELRARLEVISHRLSNDLNRSNLTIEIEPFRDVVIGPTAKVVYALLAGTYLVLLTVAGNLLNLMSARNIGSTMEQEVRLALGASSARLALVHIIEHVLIAMPAALLGMGVAASLLRIFGDLAAIGMSRAELAVVGLRAAIHAGVLAGVVLVAAAALSRSPLSGSLRALSIGANSPMMLGGRRSTRALRQSSLAVQLCLAMVLATIAMSALQLLWQIRSLPLGFEPNDLVGVALEPAKGGDSAQRALQDALINSVVPDVQRVAGVEGVATASFVPLTGATIVPFVPTEDSSKNWTMTPNVSLHTVSANYFEVLRIPLLAGRTFSGSDGPQSPCVAIINRTFAGPLGGDTAAVGRTISANRSMDKDAERCSIIGVVSDVRDQRVDDPAIATLYFFDQQRVDENRVVLARSSAGGRVVTDLRRLVAGGLKASKVSTGVRVSDYVEGATRRRRLMSYQILLFAVTGFAAAMFGVAAMSSYFVHRRRAEIGVRMALGAARSHVLKALMRESTLPAVAGLASGALLVYWGHRAYLAWFAELKPLSGTEVTLAGGVLMGCVVLASIWPAARVPTRDIRPLLRSE